jgi:aquaporin Z
MPNVVRQMVAEAVGTFFLVFPGAGAPMLNGIAALGHPVSLLDVGLANGLGLGIGISATMAVSGGALNPAVSIGLWSLGKLKTAQAALYIVAELVGAIIAGLLLHLLIPHVSVALGAPAPGKGVSGLDAAGIEAVLTFLLMMAVLTTAVDREAPKIAGFGVGLVVVIDVLVGGPLTGAAMNPARAFGPELVGGMWASAWAYWVGPIAGALIAALIYRFFLQSPAPAAQAVPATDSAARRQQGKRSGRR